MKYVDISAACNAKWISSESEKAKGIESARVERKLLSNGKIEGAGYSFLPPESGNDLIVCAGQRVPIIGGGNASALDIAYFAAFGLFIDTVTLEYESGIKEEITLGFKDLLWLFVEYSHLTWTDLRRTQPCGEKVFEFVYLRDDGVWLRGAVWAHSVPLKKGEKLTAVILPNNGFINVCGLTLRE